jgi:hypothetical protein
MKVFVYRNLHKGCYSVKDWKTKRVIAHVQSIVVENAQFKVSQAGRSRVLKEKRKNVHAGILGDWNPKKRHNISKMKTGVYYNPYLCSTFIIKSTEKPIFNADRVFVHESGVSI